MDNNDLTFGGTTPDTARPPAAQGGAEHGVRAADAGRGTRPLARTTHCIETDLGHLNYAEYVPKLAPAVPVLQQDIESEEFNHAPVDGVLVQSLHRRIFADLTPHAVTEDTLPRGTLHGL